MLLALWVVLYRDDIPKNAESNLAAATVVARMPEIDALVVSADSDFASRATADPNVAFVGEDIELRLIHDTVTAVEPPRHDIGRSDPMYPQQWDKQRIHASPYGSYAIQQGNSEVTVAVLDTGAEAAHPDIAPNLDASLSRSFYPVQDDPDGVADPAAWDDKNGHGTWCLSAVGAPIDGRGISGVAPRVRLVALKVLGDHGGGSFVSLAQALIYCASRQIDIASMSLIGYLRTDNADAVALREMVERAVAYARGRGVTPIAAMGNDNIDITDLAFSERYMATPATIRGVISISATNFDDTKASYSNYGSSTAATAPGGDHVKPLLGAWAPDARYLPGEYAWMFGTSMACPNAAGVAALIVSQYGDFSPYRARGPHLAPDIVESYLRHCSTPMRDEYFYGSGMTDALAAIKCERTERIDPLRNAQ